MRGPASIRPSAAALARKASHQELQQKKSKKALVVNENLSPSQARDGSRLLNGFSHADHVPTPHPFAVSQAQMNRMNSDISMRDTSSMLSGLSRRPHSKEGKASPALFPTASGSVKSRKEGFNALPTSSPLNVRRDQSLLPEAAPTLKPDGVSHDTSNNTPPHAHIGDIIDIDAVDAVDNPFVPGHKGGMSSIDSTGRIERKLYSALGEELSFHADIDPMPRVENEVISSESDMADLGLDIPVTKRKRQGTLGGERDRSPSAKMAREQTNDNQLRESPGLPHLRGGD
ncbi:hypothetical protein SLS60_000899 [Paraconiothyrium brasiliense]|uniref:Uncharacterized protein n=1 Tax=Paraconiothyrium brasiliense TaxID=300254 RepID=A0ABR3S7J8_9PLEO